MRFVAPLLLLLGASRYAGAQTATDGSVGPALRLDGNDVVIDAALGARRGDNLFHSFETFNIPRDGSATFTGPGGIRNVISRVTGGETSVIEGALRSQVGSEGFFFINPSGVVISEGASIDVPGTFHVSDAAEMRFADGTILSTGDVGDSRLTIAAPEAFGFLGPSGGVSIEGATLDFETGQNLYIAGSSIRIENASITLDGAEFRVQASANVAPTAGGAHMQRGLDGDAAITGSLLTVGDGGIQLGAGELVLSETSIAVTAARASRTDPALMLTGNDVSITGSLLSVMSTDGYETGPLTVSAAQLVLSDVDLTTRAAGTGDGGDLLLQGNALKLKSVRIRSSAESTGSGGDLTLQGGDIHLRNVDIGTYNVGSVSPNYTPGTYFSTYEASFFDTVGGEGDVGSIRVSGEKLRLFDTTISSNTVGSGAGGSIQLDGGDISFRRADLRTSNRNSLTEERLSYAYSVSGYPIFLGFPDDFVFGANGGVGAVSITGDRLLLSNSRIESRWYGHGAGGRLDISASDLITRRGEPDVPIVDFGFGSANLIQLTSDRPGETLTLNVGYLRLRDMHISSASIGEASGGDIHVGAGAAILRSSSIETAVEGARGGAITISSDTLMLRGNSSIDTRTGRTFSGAELTSPGGEISITTGPLMLLDRSVITTSRLSPDDGGSISIRASELVVAGNGGGVRSLRTDGGFGFYGYNTFINYGGNIDIAVNGLIRLSEGGVETSSSTTYQYNLSGGNITISGDLIVLGRNGVIRAAAEDGDGGTITISTVALFATRGAAIDASSSLGVDGQIVVNGLDNPNVSQTADLASSFLDSGAVIANPCLAALIGRSELILSTTPSYATEAPTSLLHGVLSPESAEMTVGPVAIADCDSAR